LISLACANLGTSSSTLQISESIKVLDLTLPSYDSVANSKKIIDGMEYIDTVTQDTKRPKTEKSSVNPFASNKKSEIRTPKEPKGKASKQQDSDGEQNGKVSFVDLAMPSYSDSTKTSPKSVFSL